MRLLSTLILVATLGLMGGGLLLFAGEAQPMPLTRVTDTRVLSREEADRGLPVLLRGVVTWRKGISEFALQDDSSSMGVPSKHPVPENRRERGMRVSHRWRTQMPVVSKNSDGCGYYWGRSRGVASWK